MTKEPHAQKERPSIEVIRMRGAKEAFGDRHPSAFGKAAAAAPFTLRSLGLGSGVASLAAKGAEHMVLAAMIARWLVQDCPHFKLGQPSKARLGEDKDAVKALLGAIADCSRADYRKAQIEAMGYASWIKKLAQAFCPKEEGDE